MRWIRSHRPFRLLIDDASNLLLQLQAMFELLHALIQSDQGEGFGHRHDLSRLTSGSPSRECRCQYRNLPPCLLIRKFPACVCTQIATWQSAKQVRQIRRICWRGIRSSPNQNILHGQPCLDMVMALTTFGMYCAGSPASFLAASCTSPGVTLMSSMIPVSPCLSNRSAEHRREKCIVMNGATGIDTGLRFTPC